MREPVSGGAGRRRAPAAPSVPGGGVSALGSQ